MPSLSWWCFLNYFLLVLPSPSRFRVFIHYRNTTKFANCSTSQLDKIQGNSWWEEVTKRSMKTRRVRVMRGDNIPRIFCKQICGCWLTVVLLICNCECELNNMEYSTASQWEKILMNIHFLQCHIPTILHQCTKIFMRSWLTKIEC